jgi:hypothetical protein
VSTEVDATAVAEPVRPTQHVELQLCDIEAIALHYGVAYGSIGRWASEDQWTKYGHRRRRLWDMREVQISYERRHPEVTA